MGTGCNPLEQSLVNGVERILRKRFQPTMTMHKLVIDYGCDSMSDVRDIDFEDGSGHGGSLRIFHLTREPGDPGKYDVRAIGYSGYYNTGIAYARGTIDAKKLEAALAAVRIAMIATLHDVSLYRDNSIGLGSISMSSHDFHLRIRLADSTEKFLDRTFSGYQSSYEQELRLPMELAAEPIVSALGKVTFTADAPTQADRELFASHFLATFERKSAWWVTERMLELAPTLGTAEIIPAIIDWLVRGDPNEPRIRETAVAALVAITGLDLRKDEGSSDRPLEEVIADYVRECG